MIEIKEKLKFKPSQKHLQIFRTIFEKGYYRPVYSDKEPATMTLIKNGIIDWRNDYKGLIFTDYGKKIIKFSATIK